MKYNTLKLIECLCRYLPLPGTISSTVLWPISEVIVFLSMKVAAPLIIECEALSTLLIVHSTTIESDNNLLGR